MFINKKKSGTFSKVLLSGLLSLSLILSVLGFLSFEKIEKSAQETYLAPTETQLQTVKTENYLTISSKTAATEQYLPAPYKTSETFISKPLESDFPFTSVGISWEQHQTGEESETANTESEAEKEESEVGHHHDHGTEGVLVELEMRFQDLDGQWSKWLETEEEGDLHELDKKYAIAAANPSKKVQYRFQMYSDGEHLPILENVDVTFINSANESGNSANNSQNSQQNKNLNTTEQKVSNESKILRAPTILADSTSGGTTHNLRIISRETWGADESIRCLDDGLEPDLAPISSDYYERFKDELTYSNVIEQEGDCRFTWPQQYPQIGVKKFIIHHTATTSNLDNPAQAIRDIYSYHTLTRGWGDIGYNFIIDQSGQIYEGRAGGDGVVGAHGGLWNTGTVGIAVLGNYQDSAVPDAAMESLTKLLYEKGKLHGIDLDGTSELRGEITDNIIGHRDVMVTTCPGDNLYEKIPILQTLSANYKEKERFSQAYDFIDQSEIYYFDLQANETATVNVQLENIGTQSWDDQTYLKLLDDSNLPSNLDFPDANGNILARLQEGSVEPGNIGNFQFEIQAQEVRGLNYVKFSPIINGEEEVDDYSIIPVSVSAENYRFSLVESKLPPAFMKPGDAFEGYVKLRNESSLTIDNDNVSALVKLQTPNISPWTLYNSLEFSYIKEDEVGPGETATFNFTLKAPEKTGSYTVDFAPYYLNQKLTVDKTLSFTSVVYDENYEAELITKSITKQWQQNQDLSYNLRLQNLGGKVWNAENFELLYYMAPGIEVKNLTFSPEEVKIGETANINFELSFASGAAGSNANQLGKGLAIFVPKIDDQRLLMSPVNFIYEVVEKVEEASNENIRIRLTNYSGNPEITANGSFDLYAGTNYLATLNSGEVAKVQQSVAAQNNFQITVGSEIYTSDQVVRLIPTDGVSSETSSTILEIKDFENRPAWNQNLNDNQFRGILEVGTENGEIVVVNELPVEDYLRGLGEVSNGGNPEKIKTIMVAARTYAYYYILVDEKFPNQTYSGAKYHLDNDPDTSQKYIGYGFEKRGPDISDAVDATRGEVVTYNGDLVKTPYFNQSDGTQTKSAQEVWGWTNTPYLISVDDSVCDGDQFLGHGVGLSGCGASAMADSGSTYVEILKHYYTGVEVGEI